MIARKGIAAEVSRRPEDYKHFVSPQFHRRSGQTRDRTAEPSELGLETSRRFRLW